MTLDAVEFIRRFLLQVLPSGLVRIRHFGFLANRVRRQKLLQCRALLAASAAPIPIDSDASSTSVQDLHACPICQRGRSIVIELLRVIDGSSGHLVMATLHPVPAALPGSDRNLSRSLSTVDRVPAESSPATRRRQLIAPRKPLLPLPTGPLSCRMRHRKPQKAVQYPDTRSGSVP